VSYVIRELTIKCKMTGDYSFLDEALEQYAKSIQIDNIPKFKYELEQHVYAARVREDFLSGVRSGVNGTPTFFINGIRYDDSWNAESLEGAIKNIL
jgi:protein-disulfide isomerase